MKTPRFRYGLLSEILTMAVATLVTNKMRSALTILGVVIGVTSIVGMTSLIRGFGDQMERAIRQLGSDTIYVAKMSIASFASGKEFWDLIRRPDLTEADARAIKAGAPSAMIVGLQVGGGPDTEMQRISRGKESTKQMAIIGASANFAETNYMTMEHGRFFNDFEVEHRRNVVVLGYAPGDTLFKNLDPIGRKVRIGNEEFTVVGVMGKRPSPLGGNPDEFAVIPMSTYDKLYDPPRFRGIISRFVMISIVPYPGTSRAQIISEVEEVMRARHRLKLDQENDFDIVTSDLIMKIFDQLTRAVFLALVVISSIALMVGGIGVMRRDILLQFLLEAVFLTSLGGLLGIAFGSTIGLLVHVTTGFPVSLPWWSFAIGLGFSATVGIFFGMYPAFKAARLDPIEALRYE